MREWLKFLSLLLFFCCCCLFCFFYIMTCSFLMSKNMNWEALLKLINWPALMELQYKF